VQAFWDEVSLDLMSRYVSTLKFGVKLDEYWVASFFVQLPENKSHDRRFFLVGAWTIAIAAAAMLALAAAVQAETTPAAPPIGADSVPAPVEQIQPEEPAVESVPATPKPETTDVAAATTGGDGESSEPEPSAPEPISSASAPPSSTSADQPLRAEIDDQAPVDPQTQVAATTERVSALSTVAGRGGAKLDAEPVAAVHHGAVPIPATVRLGPTRETLPDTTSLKGLFGLVEQTVEQVVDVGSLAALVASVEDLAPEVGAPLGATPATATPIGTHVFFFPQPPRLTGKPLVGTAEIEPIGLLAEHRSEFDAASSSRLRASGSHEGVDGARSLAAMTPWSANGLERSSEPANERAPRPAPSRSPGESVGAIGSASSSFVPLVALLALLALVAPAGLRRLREAPVLRASTPFVCALERPG
jgi:hypothetical protein